MRSEADRILYQRQNASRDMKEMMVEDMVRNSAALQIHPEDCHGWPGHKTAPASEPVTLGMKLLAAGDLACMSRCLGRGTDARGISRIQRILDGLLDKADTLARDGSIQPWRTLRLSADDPVEEAGGRPLRLGIFPVKANPIHWGHILAGLSALVNARLDKVVYLLSFEANDGSLLLPDELRFDTARALIESFSPLLTFSHITHSENGDDKPDAFGLLELNPTLRIDAFYMAGAGYFRGGVMESLENTVLRSVYSRITDSGQQHTLSFLFMRQDGMHGFPETILPRLFVESPLPDASSQDIMGALDGGRDSSDLTMLPFGVYRCLHMAMNGMDITKRSNNEN